MTACVLDACAALNWYFPDRRSAAAEGLLLQVEAGQAIVPDIWKFEVANVLARHEMESGVHAGAAFLDFLLRLPITFDHHFGVGLMRLAVGTGLTVYDAAYLELALRRKLPLATADKDLQAAARAAGVPLIAC